MGDTFEGWWTEVGHPLWYGGKDSARDVWDVATAAERERCIRIAEDCLTRGSMPYTSVGMAGKIADAIRKGDQS